jgi:hypothetical protein
VIFFPAERLLAENPPVMLGHLSIWHQAGILCNFYKKVTMKTIMFLLLIAGITSCNPRNERPENSSLNAEENVEENSGENISPQLEDSTDRFKVDSISSANEANEEKKNDLENEGSTQQ